MTTAEGPALGARLEAEGVRFTAWSDHARRVSVVLYERPGQISREVELPPLGETGTFTAHVAGVLSGALYDFRIDEAIAVDPYARALPFGVNGPARVVSAMSPPANSKRAIDLDGSEVFYELHVGTFTQEGTLRSAIRHLRDLRELGVTVIELMPLASFAGTRGWGYDGVGLFAPFAGYGTPEDVHAFVDAVHAEGMSVVLDVVYNHLGPAGNSLPVFSAAYFHPERRNPWGASPDLEHEAFRRLIIENARYWLKILGFDGLRLDATHELEPGGTPHVLEAIAEVARQCVPPAVLVAEDSRNDPHALLALGIDGLWSDDFHHSTHVLLTGEQEGYYSGYSGELEEVARIIRRGQLYEGQPNRSGGKPRGKPCPDVPPGRFLFALQNHDQVGNRAQGERLHQLTRPEAYRAAAVLLAFVPQTPFLFMGQEWADNAPFFYFSDHEGELGQAVTRGRIAEFGHFSAFNREDQPVPDPQVEETFQRSKLHWLTREVGPQHALLELYRSAFQLRHRDPVLSRPGKVSAGVSEGVLWVLREREGSARLLLTNLGQPRSLARIAGHSLRDARVLLSSRRLDSVVDLPADCSVILEVETA